MFIYYRAGISVTEALRQAQQEMRQRGYAHPYFWAPFQVQGAAFDQLPNATWPTNIPPVATIIPSYASRHAKGAIPMSTPDVQHILHDMQTLITELNLSLNDIPSDMWPADARATFRDTLSTLAKEASATENEEQLLELAHHLISEVEQVKALRDFYLGDIDPERARQSRAVCLSTHKQRRRERITQQHEESKSVANKIHSEIKEMMTLLEVPDTPTSHSSIATPPSETDSGTVTP